jgi:hypothetical protein
MLRTLACVAYATQDGTGSAVDIEQHKALDFLQLSLSRYPPGDCIITGVQGTAVGAMVAGPDAVFTASAGNSKKISLLAKPGLCNVAEIDK